MNRSFKTEIAPTALQIKIIEDNVLIARHAFNLYLNLNLSKIERGEKQFGSERFLRWYYTKYLKRPENIDRLPQKFNRHSVEKSVRNAAAVVKEYSEHRIGRPNYKKTYLDNSKVFFSNSRIEEYRIMCDGSRIRLNGIGWVRLKEKDYFPDDKACRIISAYISKKAGRYYLSMTADMPAERHTQKQEKNDAVELSVGKIETKRIAVLEKRIRREKKRLKRKLRYAKAEGRRTGKNIQKEKDKIYKLTVRRDNARRDCIRKSISYVVGLNPEYVAVHEECAFSDYGVFKRDLAMKCRQNKIALKTD